MYSQCKSILQRKLGTRRWSTINKKRICQTSHRSHSKASRSGECHFNCVIIIGISFLYINFRTADEWKNFYLVSSKLSCMICSRMKLTNRFLLALFVLAQFLCLNFNTIYLLEEAHQLVIKLLRLIEEAYGKTKISGFIYSKCDGNQRYITKKIIELQTIYFPFGVVKVVNK